MQNQSPSIDARLKHLHQSYNVHLELSRQLIAADCGNLYIADFVALAVVQRSLHLIQGFSLLIEHRNLLCAAPLIRLQIDSTMRLYAIGLAQDPEKVLAALLKDENITKLKSRDRQKLTDSYLRMKASEQFPWMEKVYAATSGFIHLSSPHMQSVVEGVGNKPGENRVSFSVGVDAGRQWTDPEILEAVEAFIAATDALFKMVGSLVAFKNEKAKHRL